MHFPMQPVVLASDGVIRFQENRIVSALLDWASDSGLDLNRIAVMAQQGKFSEEEQMQLAQLIGYSISGFHELDYVSDEAALAASAEARKINPEAGGCRDDGCGMHTQGDHQWQN